MTIKPITMKDNGSKVTVCFAVSLLALLGCQTSQRAPVAAATTTLSCRLPVVTPLPETRQAQEKGGVEISVAPATYKASLQTKVRQKRIQPNTVESLQMMGISESQRATTLFVEETRHSTLKPSPDRLSFLVKINNKLSRVFRGAGTVVQFNVGGRLLAVDQSAYVEMVQAIVPPRTEQQLTISGPTLDGLPESGTIGFFLYDVVTAIDAAGNVTEKQNYEWYFSFASKTEERSVEVSRPVHKLIDVHDFRPEAQEQ